MWGTHINVIALKSYFLYKPPHLKLIEKYKVLKHRKAQNDTFRFNLSKEALYKFHYKGLCFPDYNHSDFVGCWQTVNKKFLFPSFFYQFINGKTIIVPSWLNSWS